MCTRFPFRYGIASLTALPHLFVVAEVEVDGRVVKGVSADGLPPKWFTKNPNTAFEDDDLPAMFQAIRTAANSAMAVGAAPDISSWWCDAYSTVSAAATRDNTPALLSNFGFSLMERAVLDAVCRRRSLTLRRVLQSLTTEALLKACNRDVPAQALTEILSAQPLRTVTVRHTIGLGDPLDHFDAEQQPSPSDRLPFSLEENIRRYGLTHFKVKLGGLFETDAPRLRRIAEIVTRLVGPNARFTLDGNENYQNVSAFREDWEGFHDDNVVREFIQRSLLFVEQPIHRDLALSDAVFQELADWKTSPPMIIDESDADFDCLPQALKLGYSGTSHKNCKGIVKGLINAATIRHSSSSARPLVMSAEDLVNAGPVALHQDLAMVATLGITHVERNGHHYFAGLSHLPQTQQHSTLESYPHLYCQSADSFPTLKVVNGKLDLSTLVDNLFGVIDIPEMGDFEPCVP